MRAHTIIKAGALLCLSSAAFAQAATMACKDESGRDGSCELDSKLNASIRIGINIEDGEGQDADLAISNFGSRLRWGGETALTNGLNAIAYMEFGINPDENGPGNSGVDRTRQLWAGLAGDFGQVKIGAQYAAFYDMISSHTDIAYWGSCWTQQFECSRDTRVLKYEGEAGALSYAASFTGDPNDEGNDIADELEAGVNYALGDITVGLGMTVQADASVVDEESGVVADNDGGVLFGAVAKGNVGDAGLALGLQIADEDYADSTDTATNLTFSGSYANAYLVANLEDIGDVSPYYMTLGYAMSLDPAATIYYEAQIVDDDDGTDSTIIGRAVFIYSFDAISLAAMK